jgi:hypothetical protein
MMTLKWVPIIVSRASSFIRPGCLIPVIGAGFRRTSPFILSASLPSSACTAYLLQPPETTLVDAFRSRKWSSRTNNVDTRNL